MDRYGGRDPSGPKVLWVTPNLRGAAGGPTSTVLNGLIAERNAGMEPEIATSVSQSRADESGALARLGEAGVPFHLFRRVGRSDPSAAWGLSLALTFWLIRNLHRYDVLHLQYVWCWTTITGCALARLLRIPVVITPHESLTTYDIEVASRSKTKRHMKEVLRRFILNSIDALVLMSGLEERDTDSGAVPVHRVPHAILPSTRAESQGQDYESERRTEGMRIGFIGRQTPKKGIDRLIRAISLAGNPSWMLSLAGPLPEPGLEAEYRDLVSDLGLGEQVRWLGFVDDRDSYLASLDVLIMPSEYEGFGMVGAEAMASGTAVVVPRESGIAEVIEAEGGGLVVDKPEPELIAAALEALSENPERRSELGRAAKRAISTTHSPERFAASSREVYERTLAAAGDSN